MANQTARKPGTSAAQQRSSLNYSVIPGGLGQNPGGPSDLHYTASTLSRILASVTDGITLGAFYTVVLYMTGGPKSMFALIVALFFIIVFQILTVRIYGQTPGKMVLGLHVVNDADFREPSRGLPLPSLLAATARVIGTIIGNSLCIVPMIPLLNSKRRGFHDWISGTRVVQLRPRDRAPAPRVIVFLLLILLPVAGMVSVLVYAKYRFGAMQATSMKRSAPPTQLKALEPTGPAMSGNFESTEPAPEPAPEPASVSGHTN